MQKIIRIIAILYFVASVICGAYLYSRLASYRQQLVYYRTELDAASDRQSEVREVVERTGEVLSKTANSVAELRVQLQEVEDSYNYMWELLHNNNNCVDNKGGN